MCDAGIKTKLEEEVSSGYCQNLSLWGYSGIAIYKADFEFISVIMNFLMCNDIRMHAVMNMVLVLLVISDSCGRVRGDTLSLLVYSEKNFLCHDLIHLMSECFGEVNMHGAIFTVVLEHDNS